VPPRQSGTLTEAELRIMNVLWGKGSGTVQQVLDSISEKPALAYNSVLTTIRVLERKGYLKHLKDGRAHVYTPLVGKVEATRSEIRHLVSRFFKNSHEQLVLNLLEDQGIEPEEIGRLRQMLVLNADPKVAILQDQKQDKVLQNQDKVSSNAARLRDGSASK